MTATIPTGPATLAAALADLQTQLPHISKDKTAKVDTKTGPGYRYNYSDLAQVSREVLPLLGKLGLSFVCRPTFNDAGRFVLAYELLHTSGEQRTGEYPLTERGTPQQIGGEITYARRYALCAVTGVAPDDDDDDAQAAERAAGRREQRAARGQHAGNDRREPGPGADQGEPGMTGAQQRKMQALYTQVGVTDRDHKLRYAIETIGREIRSSTELTRVEAGRVIDRLERWAAQDEPPPGGEG